MSIISILPEELSNRIAAGEVVERPASVVKELFENAVDAGATVITVEIERAGSRLIKITDNGCGMDEEDAMLCFSPHATSKIKNAADIERILTLGFRGEALPSIASVSKVSLKTRTAQSAAGTEITLEGGRIIASQPAGMAVGTVFTVRDLFYNVPARKKFLRSPATEEAHIQEMVLAMALGFPSVSITLKFDGKTALQAPGTDDPVARAAGLFGKTFANRMLKVEAQFEGIRVSGLIATPGFTRTSRREQRTFVNGRAVESLALYRGIRDGYGTLADFGRYPPTVLNIEMDASEYDINVHPTKREVRFKREYAISRAVTTAIGQALHQAPTPEITLPPDKRLARPEMLLDAAAITYHPAPEAPTIPGLDEAVAENISRQPPTVPAKASTVIPTEEITVTPVNKQRIASELPSVSGAPTSVIPEAAEIPEKTVAAYHRPTEEKFTDLDNNSALEFTAVPKSAAPLAQELSDSENFCYVGILFGTFIILEMLKSETMYLIDFHAAHERVLYEELLKQAAAKENVSSQPLLLPITIEMSRTAAAFISKNEDLFSKLGFDVALLSSNTILLNAVPSNLAANSDWEMILTDLTAIALDGEKTTRDSLEAIARAACHAAVKAHDPLNEISAAALLKSLAQCQRPDVCPHGRPTVLKMSKQEIARRFGRSN